MRFIRLKFYDRSDELRERIINFDNIRDIKKDYDTLNHSYTIFIEGDIPLIDLKFKNEIDADKCFDYLIEKFHAFRIEENPW